MKTCTKCGETKALDAFPPTKGKCKGCVTAYQKEYSKKHRDVAALRARLWYASNKDKRKTTADRWRAANPDKARAIGKRWRDANPEISRARHLRNREAMSPAYTANRLRLPLAEISPKLLELKREQLAIHRLAKQVKQHLKGSK